MPDLPLILNRILLIARNLLPATACLLLAVILSGCSVVGFKSSAALQVTSTPEASVFLDGKHIGKTPFFSDQLKAGEYTLKVTVADAYYVDKITLSEGTLLVVNRDLNSSYIAQAGETLSLIPDKKGLFVVSLPTGADVTIDGSYAGKTPLKTQEIKDGDHRIQIAKEGYVEREFAIKSASKYQVLADVALSSQIAKGVNTISKEPQKIEIERILILSTPQGFLRVRKDASLSSEEVGRVTSGKEYELIQQADDWFQISFDGKTGWISAVYAQKVE